MTFYSLLTQELASERDDLHQKLLELSSLKYELEKASAEFDMLRGEFEKNMLALREELERSKARERELQCQLRDAVKTLENKEVLAEGLKAEKQRLENETKGFETAAGEMAHEREMLRKQNSEHLIKISGLEARLEEFRRGADSPYELELRVRISGLQDELERSRAELTTKFREVRNHGNQDCKRQIKRPEFFKCFGSCVLREGRIYLFGVFLFRCKIRYWKL